MERKKENETRISWFIKSLLAAYAVSCVMLFGLSFLLYKFDLSEQTVQIGIILTYIVLLFKGWNGCLHFCSVWQAEWQAE